MALEALEGAGSERENGGKKGVLCSTITHWCTTCGPFWVPFSHTRLMQAIDDINRLWGQDTIFFGIQRLIRSRT